LYDVILKVLLILSSLPRLKRKYLEAVGRAMHKATVENRNARRNCMIQKIIQRSSGEIYFAKEEITRETITK
jgi:hypothetical protein